MITTVEFHENSRPSVRRWFASLGDPEDRAILFGFFQQEIFRYLKLHHGRVPGALREKEIDPPVFWWHFNQGNWLRYAVRDVPGGLWTRLLGQQRREVLIMSVGESPPDTLLLETPQE